MSECLNAVKSVDREGNTVLHMIKDIDGVRDILRVYIIYQAINVALQTQNKSGLSFLHLVAAYIYEEAGVLEIKGLVGKDNFNNCLQIKDNKGRSFAHC